MHEKMKNLTSETIFSLHFNHHVYRWIEVSW